MFGLEIRERGGAMALNQYRLLPNGERHNIRATAWRILRTNVRYSGGRYDPPRARSAPMFGLVVRDRFGCAAMFHRGRLVRADVNRTLGAGDRPRKYARRAWW